MISKDFLHTVSANDVPQEEDIYWELRKEDGRYYLYGKYKDIECSGSLGESLEQIDKNYPEKRFELTYSINYKYNEDKINKIEEDRVKKYRESLGI